MQIKFRHLQAAVRIPRPACAHVEQPGSGFGEHVASIDEVQIDLFAGMQRLGKDDRNHVVAAPRQLRAFEGLVVDELDAGGRSPPPC